MLIWKGKAQMGSTLDKELQARRNAESRIVFPRKEHANMLSNSKRSAENRPNGLRVWQFPWKGELVISKTLEKERVRPYSPLQGLSR